MPQAEPLPIVGPRCGALRIRDGEHNWRIMCRADPDAVLVLEVYAKKTRTIPQEVIERCKKRLREYDEVAKQLLRAFAAAGGRIAVKQVGGSRSTNDGRGSSRGGRKKAKGTVSQLAELQIELIESES